MQYPGAVIADDDRRLGAVTGTDAQRQGMGRVRNAGWMRTLGGHAHGQFTLQRVVTLHPYLSLDPSCIRRADRNPDGRVGIRRNEQSRRVHRHRRVVRDDVLHLQLIGTLIGDGQRIRRRIAQVHYAEGDGVALQDDSRRTANR